MGIVQNSFATVISVQHAIYFKTSPNTIVFFLISPNFSVIKMH